MTAYNMATLPANPMTKTLGVATADTITIPGGFATITVINQDATSTISVRTDGTAAVSDADNTWPVLPKTQQVIPIIAKADGSTNTVSLIAPAAAKYTILTSLQQRSVLGY